MNEIKAYIRIGELPKESKQAHKIRIQTTHFTLIGDNLYRQYFGGPYLRCLNDTEAQYVLADDATHGSLALKAYQQNLYLEYYY